MAFIQVSFMSKTLMRTVPLQVILPVDKFTFGQPEREEKPFKTLYLLHGIFGNETDWVHGTRIQRWAEEKNLAVVMPAGENAFYVDQPSIGAMHGQFIGEELVEITRKMFPLSRKREDTFIGGLSMGGFGALRNGLKYHETFGAVICLSGALHVLENPEESRADSFAHEEGYFGNLVEAAKSDKNPAVLIEQLKEARKKDPSVNVPTVFQACGTEDGLLEVNRLYHKRMEESGMDIVYYESKGGHEWDFWDEWIKKALDWLPLEEKTEGLNSGNVNV